MSEGQVRLSVVTSDRHIVVEFERPQTFVRFTPDQAVKFAEAILKKVIAIKPEEKSNIILLPGLGG